MIWGRDDRTVPLLGVRGAGKTYFLVSLGYLVSRKDWGRVVGEEGAVYVEDLVPHVLRREPVPPTRGNYPLEVEVDAVEDPLGRGEVDVDLTVSTEDFSGGEFEAAMEHLTVGAGFDAGPAAAFYDLYADADGLLVVVDLVRGTDPDVFAESPREHAMEALSEQVVPLVKGLKTALDAGDLDGKPIYVAFTKADVHGFRAEDLEPLLRRAMPFAFQDLAAHGCTVTEYAVSAVSWAGEDDDRAVDVLQSTGYGDLLRNMARQFG